MVTRLLKATLFETNVYDPLTFATVPVVLGIPSLASLLMPEPTELVRLPRSACSVLP